MLILANSETIGSFHYTRNLGFVLNLLVLSVPFVPIPKPERLTSASPKPRLFCAIMRLPLLSSALYGLSLLYRLLALYHLLAPSKAFAQ